jgi:hypothetical protein
MTTAHRAGSVRLHADLEVVVDGRLATVSADGTHVRVRADDPVPIVRQLQLAALQAGVGHVGPAHALGRVADELAAAGLTASVEGPHGPVLHLGVPGSRLGRWVTGSAVVRPGPVSGWRAVIGGAAVDALRPRRSWPRQAWLGATAGAVALTVVVAAVLRRRQH